MHWPFLHVLKFLIDPLMLIGPDADHAKEKGRYGRILAKHLSVTKITLAPVHPRRVTPSARDNSYKGYVKKFDGAQTSHGLRPKKLRAGA